MPSLAGVNVPPRPTNAALSPVDTNASQDPFTGEAFNGQIEVSSSHVIQ